MTADKLQEIVLGLAKTSFVRYHKHWNYPNQSPWIMVIQIRNCKGQSVHVRSLDTIGFEWDEVKRVHFIDRTNDDGTPFQS
jgi:hypothetical protein